MSITVADTVVTMTGAVGSPRGLLQTPLPHPRNGEIQFNADRDCEVGGLCGNGGGQHTERGSVSPRGCLAHLPVCAGQQVLQGRPRAVCTFGGAKLLEPQKPPNGTWGVGWPSCLAELFPLASD